MANDGTVKIGIEADESGFKSSLSKLGGVAKTAMAGVTAATTAASAAIGVLAKKSLDAYGEYEQLTGGIETLFEDLDYDIIQNAQKAYKTAGLSANEYMDTVMGFAASLNQSLKATEGNIARSADLADQTIIDMADNANKMGSSMESIQNAYQGFAKQNFTMLDNLKLGYGGTKQEMERLLEDAEKLSGIHFDISSFSDIVEAIHVVQSDLGITGTTAEEAASTIQGSLASMGAAWQNLVTGIADEDADLDMLIENFVSSLETAAENMIPRLEKILAGVGDLVEKLAPVIAEKLPDMMAAILPPLIQAAGTLIQGLAAALPELLTVISDAVHQAIDSIGQSLAQQIPALSLLFENLDNVVTAAAVAFVTLKTATLAYQAASSVAKIIEHLTAVTNGQTIAQAALNAVMNANPFVLIATTILTVIAAIISLTLASEGFRDAMVDVLNAIGDAIQAVIETLKSAVSWFQELFGISSSASNNVGGSFGGGGSRSSANAARSAPMAAAESEPAAFSLSTESTEGLSAAMRRANMLRSLESAIPAASERVSIATAAMAPAAGYSAPSITSGERNGANAQQAPIILRPNWTIRFGGNLAQLGRLMKTTIDTEDRRAGPSV